MENIHEIWLKNHCTLMHLKQFCLLRIYWHINSQFATWLSSIAKAISHLFVIGILIKCTIFKVRQSHKKNLVFSNLPQNEGNSLSWVQEMLWIWLVSFVYFFGIEGSINCFQALLTIIIWVQLKCFWTILDFAQFAWLVQTQDAAWL